MLTPRPPHVQHHSTPTSKSDRTAFWHRGEFFRVWYTLSQLGRESLAPLNLINYVLCALLWRIGLLPAAVATIIVVSANLIITAMQLGRAQAALVRMQKAFQAPVAVWRANVLQEVPPADIQPNDILMLRPGDRIPTSVVVLESAGLLVDMAAQTGESDPVSVGIGMTIAPGCTVRAGAAWVQSTAGVPIQAWSRGVSTRRHGVQSAMLIRILHGSALCAAVIALGTLCLGFLHGAPLEQHITAVTVVIGLIPNALVLFAAVTQARAAVSLTQQAMVINTPSVVERMADVDVVCFDKTGTLTTNALTVAQVIPLAVRESECIDLLGSYCAADGAGNQSSLTLGRAFPRAPMAVVTSTAFESTRKWSLIQTAEHTYVLGAPDVLAASLAPEWHHVRDMGSQHPDGRVLLFLSVPNDWEVQRSGAIPLGAVVLHDELRAGVHEVMTDLRAHGIRVIVLSGDDPHAVSRVATAAGIVDGRRVHASLLPKNTMELVQSLTDVSVIGRMYPADKSRVVQALQVSGRRVAFVGDGFNDMDALRVADVAVAFAAAHAVVRDSADVVIVGADLRALSAVRHSGEHVARRLAGIGQHVVTRVGISAVVWVGTNLLTLPTWTPVDSSTIALFGVAVPIGILITVPHAARADDPLRHVLFLAVGVGLCLVAGWWGAVTVFGVADVRWLTGAVIVSLWVLLALRVLRRSVVVT